MWWVIIRMAWRNLWRNTRRTIITALAIGLGLASMILALGWMNGMTGHMVQTITLSGYGDAQIHAPGWRKTRAVEKVLDQGAAVMARSAANPVVAAAAPRLYGIGLLAIGDRSANIEVIGIDTALEPEVTNWHERLTAGRYPQADNEAIIGRHLAEKMEVGVGSRLVLTVADALTGDMNSLLIKVCGLAVTSNPVVDRGAAVLPIATVRRMLGLEGVGGAGGGIHELALSLRAESKMPKDLAPIVAGLAAPGIEVAPWSELSPAVAGILELQGFYMVLSLVIIFAIIAFGIVNTMSMALLERFREFGILRAVGTTPGRLAWLILMEAASLGVVGCAIGLIVGLGINLVLSHTGIELGQMEAMGVTFEDPIYTVLKPLGVIMVTLMFMILTPLVAVWPAVRAAKVEPVRALRHQ